jgi:hypothetical protein
MFFSFCSSDQYYSPKLFASLSRSIQFWKPFRELLPLPRQMEAAKVSIVTVSTTERLPSAAVRTSPATRLLALATQELSLAAAAVVLARHRLHPVLSQPHQTEAAQMPVVTACIAERLPSAAMTTSLMARSSALATLAALATIAPSHLTPSLTVQTMVRRSQWRTSHQGPELPSSPTRSQPVALQRTSRPVCRKRRRKDSTSRKGRLTQETLGPSFHCHRPQVSPSPFIRWWFTSSTEREEQISDPGNHFRRQEVNMSSFR